MPLISKPLTPLEIDAANILNMYLRKNVLNIFLYTKGRFHMKGVGFQLQP